MIKVEIIHIDQPWRGQGRRSRSCSQGTLDRESRKGGDHVPKVRHSPCKVGVAVVVPRVRLKDLRPAHWKSRPHPKSKEECATCLSRGLGAASVGLTELHVEEG
jgi:hypothetical protein